MALKSDQPILEVKEPIVLDADGNQIYTPDESFKYSRSTGNRKFNLSLGGSGWLAPIMFILIGGVVIAFGTLFFGVFSILAILFLLVRFFLPYN